jgi:hypothetical protein
MVDILMTSSNMIEPRHIFPKVWPGFPTPVFLGYRWLFILLILVELLTITVFMIWFWLVMYGCVGYHIGRLCATGDKPCIQWFIDEHLMIMSVCHWFDIIILIVMIAVAYRVSVRVLIWDKWTNDCNVKPHEQMIVM